MTIEIAPIASTSASLAELMRSCLLRAGLSRARPQVNPYVLGSPRAWLGTAYHRVLERLAGELSNDEALATTVERLWGEAVDDQARRARDHPLDRRFGEASRWPGYYLVHASVLLRAKSLAVWPATGGENREPQTLREHELTAYQGRLVGRPDAIAGDTVIDYKSGAVVGYDEQLRTELVNASYVRQLRIYGFLVWSSLGYWPRRGVLLPPIGAEVVVDLDAAECEEVARDAVGLLDDYNKAIREVPEASALASPSYEACRWCPFKPMCEAFWAVPAVDWPTDWRTAAIEGQITAVSTVGDGASLAMSIEVKRGTQSPGLQRVSPLVVESHASGRELRSGEDVRITDLRIRQDGLLAPTDRTLVFRTVDMPSVAIQDTMIQL